MEWSSGDNWVAELDLPTGTVYEYKFVVVDYGTGNPIMWQNGNNSVLVLRSSDRDVDVFDNWCGGDRWRGHIGGRSERGAAVAGHASKRACVPAPKVVRQASAHSFS